MHDDPDFWSVAALTELRVYQSLERRGLADQVGSIIKEFEELHFRVRAVLNWQSIDDTARFVLLKYAKKAPATEKAAVTLLLKTLAGWAEGLQSLRATGVRR